MPNAYGDDGVLQLLGTCTLQYVMASLVFSGGSTHSVEWRVRVSDGIRARLTNVKSIFWMCADVDGACRADFMFLAPA